MSSQRIISGFSRMDRKSKLERIVSELSNPVRAAAEIDSYRHNDPDIQKLHDEFSENTVSNFFLPWGIAPNFVVNGKVYLVPMVTEESSVVAAASRSAKFWSSRGGFRAEVTETVKNGQVHFIWKGNYHKLKRHFPLLIERMKQGTRHITSKMESRGGGITNIDLVDGRRHIEDYYQVTADFDTRDSMGANFINSCLEEFATIIKEFFDSSELFELEERNVEILMAILSNYTDRCIVKASVACHAEELVELAGDMDAARFAEKFLKAVKIASFDVRRATTHNKGIFNGIDAVVIATGNDFRAVESAGHAWAARDGSYRSLSEAAITDNIFSMSLTIPMSVGTVGGLTRLHPMAGKSLEVLGNPDARELMGIIASAGLATNFAAVSSLVTKGIQSGHMKMHLSNILNQAGASQDEKDAAINFFKNKKIGFSAVQSFLTGLRETKNQSL